MTVKYKMGDRTGEQKVIVSPETPDRGLRSGRQERAQAGRAIIIMNATKQPDGTLQTPAVNVGRGVTPPM